MVTGARWTSLLVSVLCVLSCEATFSGDTRLLHTLRDALAQRRYAIPSWFEAEIPPCNWSGIACEADLVHGIDLSGTGMDLPIPACMGEFRGLRTLNLSNGGFSGPIPETFANLLALQLLDLSHNQISGTLPSWIFALRMLKELVLDSCDFSGELTSAVGRLGNLTRLSLSGNSFTGALPSELGNLQSLEYLDLSMNSFDGNLPSSLGNLTRLLHLDASRNGFTGSIFGEIGFLRELLTLDLSFNFLTGFIPPVIGRLKTLESLWLGSNGLTGSIPPEIGNLSRLKILTIQGCRLTGSIPEEISHLRSLLGLDISENSFEGQLPAGIGELTDLVYLIAAHSGLSGRIPEELGNCRSLRTLDLSFNSLSGPLPDALAALESIGTFIVEGNQISGPIPEWINGWEEINSIRLSKNMFVGSLPPLKLPSLTTFSADANLLTGEIPPQICGCRSLALLSLSENELTGNISGTFRECFHLTDLILAGNKLSGEVPGYLGDLPLVTLELSQNNFSGELPNQLLRSSTILELSLSSNQLTGRIPDAIGETSSVQRLQLDGNLFEGSIPKSFGKLKNLTNLSLRGNRLSGEIPAELFGCTNLVALDLGANDLSGPIPKTISQLKLLDNLVLSGNRLSGDIPGEICAGFQKMAPPDSEFTQHYGVLDLSCNAFTGPIPAAIKDCVVIMELKLQGNKLSGGIPPELVQLVNLTFLDLSSNLLTGPIPPQLFPLKNLQGLVLSNNLINGSIPDSLGAMLPSLVKLNLSMNKLTGGFPSSVFAVRSLTHLDVSTNFLSGPVAIPSGVAGETSSLLVLNASNNHLGGGISFAFSNLTSISILDLHNNELSGRLPPFFTNLASLTYLDISDNNLEDAIPCDICSIEGLSFANLSGNRFTRYMPENCAAARPCPSNLSAALLLLPVVAYPGSARALSNSSVLGISLGGAAVFLALLLALLRWRTRRKKAPSELLSTSASKSKSSTSLEPASTEELLGKKTKEPLSINIATFEHPLLRLTLADILKATDNFSKAHVIGDGGFGTVYRAVLSGGGKVAVKRLTGGGGHLQGDREFLAEMETIGKVNHRHLVPLLGYCVFNDERFLIYEYMEKGSLDLWLRNRADAAEALRWPVRLRICLGAARGLAFLHHGFVPHIIHRDMKSSNILLDRDFQPRVSDFGLARIISACETHVSTDLAGTFGYIPPEYGQTMKATAKGDVYSFGVVALELLTGRPPTGQEEGEGGGNLVGWVRWMMARRKLGGVFDACLPAAGVPREQMRRVLAVAVTCTADEPWKRPTMLEVVRLLKEIDLLAAGPPAVATRCSSPPSLPSLSRSSGILLSPFPSAPFPPLSPARPPQQTDLSGSLSNGDSVGLAHGQPAAQGQPPLQRPSDAQGPLRRRPPLPPPLLLHRPCHPGRKADVSGYPADQRGPVHREPGDAGDVEPAGGVVPVQPAGVPHGGEPSAAGDRGGSRARVPPGWAVRQDGAAEGHAHRRRRRLAGRRRVGGHPQRLPDHVRHRLVQGGRRLDGAVADAHRPEEGRRQAPDCRRVGAVHRRVLLRGHLRRHLGLLPPLRPRPPLLHQVDGARLFPLVCTFKDRRTLLQPRLLFSVDDPSHLLMN